MNTTTKTEPLPREEMDLFSMLRVKGDLRLVTFADVQRAYKGMPLVQKAIWQNIETRRAAKGASL